jgi:hypothetical protein
VAIADDVKLVHLAKRRVIRRKLQLDAFRKIGRLHLLGNNCPRSEWVRVIVEGERDERETKEAFAAHQHHLRGAIEHPLDGYSHLTLDFFRRQPGKLRDDLHPQVRDVGKRLYGKFEVRLDAIGRDGSGDHQDRQAFLDAELNQWTEHGRASRSD